jgi:hypothetical protein
VSRSDQEQEKTRLTLNLSQATRLATDTVSYQFDNLVSNYHEPAWQDDVSDCAQQQSLEGEQTICAKWAWHRWLRSKLQLALFIENSRYEPSQFKCGGFESVPTS